MIYEEIELAKKNGALHKLKSHLVDSKIRERYTVSEELAILRQKEEKPEEYAAFYAYAEECKREVQTVLDAPPDEELDSVSVLTYDEYRALNPVTE